MTVIISGPTSEYRIDTPDPALIGPWIASLFKDAKTPRIGFQMTIHVTP